MKYRFLTGLLMAGMLALAGCNDALESAAKAERPLPEKLVRVMKAKGMSKSSPIMLRIFKEEGKLEVWKKKDTGRFDLVTSYDICKWSGKLGPKYMEGDRQAPEGFYDIRPWQMNPKSNYYLSFNIGFPNAYDRVHGRSGANLMVHGACSSSGCYSMTDAQVSEIFAFARDAFRGGQTEFQVQALPFRMTAANMARYKDDPNIEFWKMLKEGYDHFELTKLPPKVDVCGRRYVFNQQPAEGAQFNGAGAACPPMSQPEGLSMAYDGMKKSHDEAFSAAMSQPASGRAPFPSIQGVKEAALVAAWSKKRARGERVPVEPPFIGAASPNKPEVRYIRAPRPAAATTQDAAVTPQAALTPAPVQPAAPAAAPAAATPAPAEKPAATAQKPAAEAAPPAPTAAPAAEPQAPAPEAKKKWWQALGS
ncbi:MAG: murein L,D-transpeptidase [Notoacmeibacter sp.]|nr:murein L,D-transpeptidase [Notoacmeibacter sp.]MCC0031536.1 murein L,D-transpeptidase [Brucellaceae bacterium]